MMHSKKITLLSILLLTQFLTSSCVPIANKKGDDAHSQAKAKENQQVQKVTPPPQPLTLPVQYQAASYFVGQSETDDLEIEEEAVVRVGARITSTQGAQPLWDIMKRLAALKDMTISWAKDVDQNAKVDVNINPKDDLLKAINNLLMQVGYFAEIEGTSISVKNKITKSYQIAMPFISQTYTTETGGDIIGTTDTNSGLKATINLKAKGSPVGTNSLDEGGSERKIDFDVWANIENNLKVILDILETSAVETSAYERQYGRSEDANIAVQGREGTSGASSSGSAEFARQDKGEGTRATQEVKTSRQVSKDGSYFIIDKPVGIITVTTTRNLHERIAKYIASLKHSIYKQISIEAKIIEVQLRDASSIGVNWSEVLKNFNLNGLIQFGANGQIYPFVYSNDEVVGDRTYLSDDRSSYFKTINPGQFISNISLNSAKFDIFLNALNEQGDTKILSNPKISVLNGQPAYITVGRNVTYIDEIESTVEDDSDRITYTVETERILSGVGMALTATVAGDDEVVMNLVPITSELQEPIEYLPVGSDGGTVGLPIVNVREMNTTVKVRDGEILVIGGLISDFDQSEGEFAPFLGDIPLVKYLFGYEAKEHIKRELIILLRPRII